MKTKERNKMKRTLFHISLLIGLFVAAVIQSCTNLDEELYDTVTADNFPKTAEEFVSTMGSAYATLGGWAVGDINTYQEISTDEELVPTRGQDWDDGGIWRRVALHSWTFEDDKINGTWDFCFNGITTANRLIFQFETLAADGSVPQATADVYLSELKTLRGFFYWQAVDLFGNVPLTTDFADTTAAPATKSREEVYNFILTDLTTSLPNLTRVVDGSTYSRMTAYGAWFLLAKLYLNADVYVGTPQWQKVVDACDTIINSGKYSLESNYFTNFDIKNSGSKEFIWAIPYDKIFYTGFTLGPSTLHYGSQDTYKLTYQPWNGYCSLQEFYESYTDDDIRKGDAGTLAGKATKRGNFIAGYQYKLDGTLVDDAGGATDPDGTPVNFGNIGDGVDQIKDLGPNCRRQDGVRIGKWEFEIGGTSDMSNDYCVFRYADVLLMKAEALWRLGGHDAEALALVNQIRTRAGVADLTSLDGPLSFDIAAGSVAGGELFNEMGREMVFEHNRRQDLIRWGLYEQQEKWVPTPNNAGDAFNTDPTRQILPIPRTKKAANPNLVQNPGY
jgi:starch-binding outer membrane protein, SusD/RagB family